MSGPIPTLLEALTALHSVCSRMDLDHEAFRPTEQEYQIAMHNAALAIAAATGEKK